MSLLCPRCLLALQEGQAQDVVLHACVTCGGVWLDRQGVVRVSEALSAKALALADSAAHGASRAANETPDIDCPVCAEILIRTPVADAGVAIDRCPEHGAWYDRNELQRVAQAVARARGAAPQGRGQEKQGSAQPQKGQPQKGQPQKGQPQKGQPQKGSQQQHAAAPPQKAPHARPAQPPSRDRSDGVETAVTIGAVILELLTLI